MLDDGRQVLLRLLSRIIFDTPLVTGSYRHNPRHRLFTTAGWFRLPAAIETALRARLRARPD